LSYFGADTNSKENHGYQDNRPTRCITRFVDVELGVYRPSVENRRWKCTLAGRHAGQDHRRERRVGCLAGDA